MRTPSTHRQSPPRLCGKALEQRPSPNAKNPTELAEEFGFERHQRVSKCDL